MKQSNGKILIFLYIILSTLTTSCKKFDALTRISNERLAQNTSTNGDPPPQPTPPPPVFTNNIPVLESVPSGLVMKIGMGGLSGNIDIQNAVATGHPGEGEEFQSARLRCQSDNDNITVNCQTLNNGSAFIDIMPDRNVQCYSGSAEIKAHIEDQFFATSNEVSFNVLIESGCLPESKLLPSDGERLDQFGGRVAINSDLAVVSASGDDDLGNKSGAAYVYRKISGQWVEEAKLLASDGTDNDELTSVAISGNRIVLGSPNHNSKGAVYIFEYQSGSWIETQKLIPDTVDQGFDLFGFSLFIESNTIVVGAPGDSSISPEAGSVYIFSHDGSSWSLDDKIIGENLTGHEAFGASVSLNGNALAVGAPQSPLAQFDGPGFVYIFENSIGEWTPSDRLLPVDNNIGYRFGSSISLDQNQLLVGAPSAKGKKSQTGAAYFYSFDIGQGKWTESDKIFAPDGDTNDEFGNDVALIGSNAIVASNRSSDRTGSAYHFKYSNMTWDHNFKLMSKDRSQEDRFGGSISFFGNEVIIGSRLDDDQGDASGSAYIITLP